MANKKETDYDLDHMAQWFYERFGVKGFLAFVGFVQMFENIVDEIGEEE